MVLRVLGLGFWLWGGGGAWAGPPLPSHRDVWVQAPDPRVLQQQAGLGFVEESADGWWRVHATPAALSSLASQGLAWRPATDPPMPPGLPEGYHTPEAMVAALSALAAAHPARVTRVDLGTSRQGRAIVGVRISAVAVGDAPRAQWRVLGAHHGDELPSGEVALALATLLAETEDAALVGLLSQDAVWVVPHVNPDGVAAVSRYNAGAVDLNRNYAHEWSASAFQPGPAPFSEPETRAVRALSAWSPFLAGVSLHAGATNIGWVWNYTPTESPDDSLVATMADRYASQCGTAGFWVTNGAAWYITHGDTTDWSYGRLGTLDFTVEVSSSKAPSIEESRARVAEHLPALRELILWPDLLAGQITDAETGRGIPATVTLLEAGAPAGQPLVAGPDGRFARVVFAPGTWEISVQADGYLPATVALDTDALPSTIPLPPSEDRRTLQASPALLSRGSPLGTFQLPVSAARVELRRPGETPIPAEPLGEGRWSVDLEALAPGPWDLLLDGRWVSPRSLFVGEVDDLVQIQQVHGVGDALALQGRGFGAGSQVWALWGEDRAPVSLEILRETDVRIVVQAQDLPRDAGAAAVDLVVLSRGYQLAVHDVFGAQVLDGGAPPHGLGEGGGGQLTLRMGGCAHAGTIQDLRCLLVGTAVALAASSLRRRRPPASAA